MASKKKEGEVAKKKTVAQVDEIEFHFKDLNMEMIT